MVSGVVIAARFLPNLARIDQVERATLTDADTPIDATGCVVVGHDG
jgi:hypothetical protein